MRVRLSFLGLLLAVGTAATVRAQSPDQSPSHPQSQSAPSQAAPVAQAQPTPPPPAKKPHHVFTNDDFESLPHEASFNGGRDLLEQVNSCDRNCFDQISRAVGSNYSLDSRWKQSLLNAVDKSKEDLPWQGLLGEAIAIQAQSCELQMKKKQDMERFADPNNVTHKELLVDREYEPRFREMTRRLNEVAVRANKHIAVVTDPYLAEFMRLQLNRVVNATCRIYVSRVPSRRDPEDADTPDSDDPPEQTADNDQ
ncbi:MAG TPA: hypothetical protein VN025_01810 [Candidatus Dormibacteraeota bacterium]|jgi:hypothetical protein|nr:hypothetical protein [Candidatus Dormibacteraeota bacterium]